MMHVDDMAMMLMHLFYHTVVNPNVVYILELYKYEMTEYEEQMYTLTTNNFDT